MLGTESSIAKLQRAAQLLQQGKLAEAEQVCGPLQQDRIAGAAATHLVGLIREKQGAFPEAERLLRASVRLDARNVNLQLNVARFLRLRSRPREAEAFFRAALQLDANSHVARLGLAHVLSEQGLHAQAEAECRAVLNRRPQDQEAGALLAYSLSNQNRNTEAEAAYRSALELRPSDTWLTHNLGSLLSRMERAEEALEQLDKVAPRGVANFELSFNRGRTLALLNRIEEAEAEFLSALAVNPRHIEAHVNLARLRFMRGDADFTRSFDDATLAHPGDLPLQISLAVVERCAEQWSRAEDRLQGLLRTHGSVPEVRAELAHVYQESGRIAEAEAQAQAAAASKPFDPGVAETLVSILLMRNRAADAARIVETHRRQLPLSQGWIAYEATALRLLHDGRYRELYDYDRFVRVFEPQAPAGWRSMAELNAELLELLRQRHRLAVHPLDQSLRNGSQTLRNLLSEDTPVIRAILQSFDEPLREYLAAIGADPTRPLTARNRGAARMTGAWSVQLRREGFHVNHVHPEGWISSAYYVDVPAEVEDTRLRSGWLKFGETRYAVPGADAEHHVQPRSGRLVLFPSYMWHGTNPIHGEHPRTTIAFDAVPADDSVPARR